VTSGVHICEVRILISTSFERRMGLPFVLFED
jgi:hypothetical protein